MNEFDEKFVPEQPADETAAPAAETETTETAAPETAPAAETAPAEEMPASDAVDAAKPKKKNQHRRLRYGGLAVLVTVLVIVGTVVLNIFANVLFDRFPLSVDMTSDDRFTISQETRDMIQLVDKQVEIIGFFSEDTARNPNTGLTQMNTVFKQIYETWNQYERLSDGKVTVKYVDLTADPTLQNQYKKYGSVQEWSVLFRSGEGDNERYRLKDIRQDFYTYESDSYTGSLTSFTSQVEMATASGVKAVSGDEEMQVMLLTGHDEDEATVTALTDLYELNGYAVEQVNLASNQKTSDKATTAIIAAPAKDLSAAEITRLRDWLTNNGKLGRNLMVVMGNLVTTKDCPNLVEFLDDGYQIEITDNLVVETDDSRSLMGFDGNIIYGDLPESPVQDSAKSAAVYSGYPRQIKLKAGTDNTKTLFNVPLVTYPESCQLKSMTAGENAKTTAADEYPVAGMGMAVKWTYDNSGEESEQVETNVVVCSQGMISGAFSTIYGSQQVNFVTADGADNESVVLGIMNYINNVEDSVTVSGKDLTQTQTQFTEGTAFWLGLILAVVLPLVLLVVSLVVFLRRRHL